MRCTRSTVRSSGAGMLFAGTHDVNTGIDSWFDGFLNENFGDGLHLHIIGKHYALKPICERANYQSPDWTMCPAILSDQIFCSQCAMSSRHLHKPLAKHGLYGLISSDSHVFVTSATP